MGVAWRRGISDGDVGHSQGPKGLGRSSETLQPRLDSRGPFPSQGCQCGAFQDLPQPFVNGLRTSIHTDFKEQPPHLQSRRRFCRWSPRDKASSCPAADSALTPGSLGPARNFAKGGREGGLHRPADPPQQRGGICAGRRLNFLHISSGIVSSLVQISLFTYLIISLSLYLLVRCLNPKVILQ